MKILIAYPNLPMMLTPAMTVGIFTAICKSKNVEIDLFETTPYTDNEDQGMILKSRLGGGRPYEHGTYLLPTRRMIPDFIRKVKTYKPDLILLSIVEDCFKDAELMLKSIHHLNIPHIVGGTLPTNDPEFCLKSPYIKNICTYEGEEVLIDIIDNWPNIENVKGINNNPKPPLTNINTFIPDYSLYEQQRFYRPMGGKIVKSVLVETYRGCPYSCTFCNSPTTRLLNKSFVRQKSLEQVRKELDYYIENNDPEYWFIIDDSFTARPKKDLLALCKLLKEYKIPWWCNTRIEAVDEEILAAMKDGYCDRVQFGIECGNDDYRIKYLKRNIKNKDYYKKIDIINNSGIPYGLNVIIGMPFETEQMVFETIKLVKKFGGYDGLGVSIFIPYRGTILRKIAIDNNMLDSNWTSENGYLVGGSPLKMKHPYLQPDQIWELANNFKYYCFFDESRWIDIQREVDLEKEYNDKFYSKYAMPGSENIKRRKIYGCGADNYVEM